MVPDPFCGCATALVASDRLGRQWTVIAEERGLWGGPTALDVPPQRADLAHLLNYRTHRHRLYGEQEGICAGSIPMCSGCNRSKGGRTMAPSGGRMYWRMCYIKLRGKIVKALSP